MEQYRDEHLVCASCGESFFFSAGEARVFAERALAAPKRCKECRRVRKEQGQAGHAPSPGARGGAPGRVAGAGGAQRPPRFTGEVNEYRSPMVGDSGFAAPRWNDGDRGPAARGPAGPARGPEARRAPRQSAWGRPAGQPWSSADGVYRSPMAHNQQRNGAGRGPAVVDEASDPPMPSRAAGPAQTPPRRKPPAPTFAITCSSCGQASQVPFAPAEGREVFCQPCYRARKPIT